MVLASAIVAIALSSGGGGELNFPLKGPIAQNWEGLISDQSYLRNTVMFASTPQIDNVGDSSIYIKDISPTYVGCSIKIVRVAIAGPGTFGYAATGDQSAHAEGLVLSSPIGKVKLAKGYSFHFAVVFFQIPRACVVHLSGFDLTISDHGSIVRQWVRAEGVFHPVSHL